MESYNKLVRDNIPEILTEKGIPYEQRVAEEVEYKTELIKKLEEEIQEFSEVRSVEELADIIEVIEALKGLSEYGNVEEVRQAKLKEKGGFTKRLIVKGEK